MIISLHLQFPMNMRMLDLTIMYMMMVTYLMLLCSREEIEKGLSTVIVSCCEIMSGGVRGKKLERRAWGIRELY